MNIESAENALLRSTWKASTRRHLTYPQHISGEEARQRLLEEQLATQPGVEFNPETPDIFQQIEDLLQEKDRNTEEVTNQ